MLPRDGQSGASRRLWWPQPQPRWMLQGQARDQRALSARALLSLGTAGLSALLPPSGWRSPEGRCLSSAPQAHSPFLSVTEAHSPNLPRCLTSSAELARINPPASFVLSCSQEPTVAPHRLNGHIPDPPSSIQPGASNAPACPQESTGHPAPGGGERVVLSSHQPDRAHRLAGGRSPGWSQFSPAVRRGPATHPCRAAPSPRALRGPPGAGEKRRATARAAVLSPETGRHYFRLTSGSALVARPWPNVERLLAAPNLGSRRPCSVLSSGPRPSFQLGDRALPRPAL